MNWTIEFTEEFARGAKILKKRYKSFKHDLEDFKDSIAKNPFQGVELVPGIRKVRMAIEAKGKGKSDADTVDDKVVKHYVEELGFDLTVMQEKGLLKLRNIEQGGGTSE